MNIRSAKVDQLVERLARLTGEDVETAIERAIEERLSRVAPPWRPTGKPRWMLSSSGFPACPSLTRVRQRRS